MTYAAKICIALAALIVAAVATPQAHQNTPPPKTAQLRTDQFRNQPLFTLRTNLGQRSLRYLRQIDVDVARANQQLNNLNRDLARLANSIKTRSQGTAQRLDLLSNRFDAALATCRQINKARRSPQFAQLRQEAKTLRPNTPAAHRIASLDQRASASQGIAKDIIATIEIINETVRNRRQDEQQATFRSFDRKAQQLHQVLSEVQRAMRAMQSSVTRNLN